jgi:antitoxin component YwqK of YwqJK toxin-antitoxin module
MIKSDKSFDSSQRILGFYRKTNAKFIEYILTGFKLSSTKIFQENGKLIHELWIPYDTNLLTPKQLTYESISGYYPKTPDSILFTQKFSHGKLLSTTIFHENGKIVHELNLDLSGYLTSCNYFNEQGKLT